MTTHISLDIEALGLTPGSIILSLGAYVFKTPIAAHENLIHYHSYQVDEQAEKYGLTTDPSTEAWWQAQDEEAKKPAFAQEIDIFSGLMNLSDFIAALRAQDPDIRIWANSPSYDCRLVEAAYKAIGLNLPWNFREERCYRTMKAEFKDLINASDFEGTPHHAGHDAIHQGKHCAKILTWLDAVKSVSLPKVTV